MSYVAATLGATGTALGLNSLVKVGSHSLVVISLCSVQAWRFLFFWF